MHPLDNQEIRPLAEKSPWIMIKGQQCKQKELETEYFVVWTADTPPGDEILSAATRVPNNKDLLRSMQINFHQEPEVGFVIQTKRGWDFETEERAQQALNKLIWEVERLTRS